MCIFLPLCHNFVGVWKEAFCVLHLEGVSITDLVVCPAVVGAFYHDDIAAGTPQVDGVAFAGQLPPHQTKRECCSAETLAKKQGEKGIEPKGHIELDYSFSAT